MTATRIRDLKMYVMLNELLPNRVFKNKNYTLFLHLFNCLRMKIYFVLTIAFETAFCMQNIPKSLTFFS